MEDQPKGELFSRIYIPKGNPLPDSPRFRLRIGSHAWGRIYSLSQYSNSDPIYKFAKLVKEELGVQVPLEGVSLNAQWNIQGFFQKAEIRDVLDGISLVTRLLERERSNTRHWLDFVGRVFVEENLHYRLDDLGGVHHLVDREFERNKNAVLSCLGGKFSAVESSLDSAFSRLGREPLDTKAAVREIFDAAESLVKTITDSGQVLTERFVEVNIKPMVQRAYGKIDSATHSAAERSLLGFSQWVQAAHPYRHGQKDSKAIEPPLEIAVLLMSQGASYIRWLVEIHNLHENDGRKSERQ